MRGGRGGAVPPVRKGEGGGEAPLVERDGPRHRESGDANGGGDREGKHQRGRCGPS